MESGKESITLKKPIYPVSPYLRKYLHTYGREIKAGLEYNDLLHYVNAFPLYDRNGKDTLWESVYYQPSEMENLNRVLTLLYSKLKTGGDIEVTQHLYVERIDFCTFGNTKPFRVRIVNNYNDNFDYFYIKRADASRIYGLELEHILSPNRISYFVSGNTLVEEHIAGIPGDMFIQKYLKSGETNEIRLAKEFVKFNERCFVRLLGDMRAYNFVIDITPDFEEVHYRIRAIDFDQECYEGRKNLYLPQFYKENYSFVTLCTKHLNPETIRQYQHEERNLMAKRVKAARYMLRDLLDTMKKDTLSTPEKVKSLSLELEQHYQDTAFGRCQNMGSLVHQSLRVVVRDNLKHLLNPR